MGGEWLASVFPFVAGTEGLKCRVVRDAGEESVLLRIRAWGQSRVLTLMRFRAETSALAAEPSQHRHLGGGVGDEAFAAAFGEGRLAVGVEFGLFEVREDFLRPGDDRVGESGEARDLDPVALVRAAGHDFPQEDDLVVPFADGDIEVEDAGARAFEVGELVVV